MAPLALYPSCMSKFWKSCRTLEDLNFRSESSMRMISDLSLPVVLVSMKRPGGVIELPARVAGAFAAVPPNARSRLGAVGRMPLTSLATRFFSALVSWFTGRALTSVGTSVPEGERAAK